MPRTLDMPHLTYLDNLHHGAFIQDSLNEACEQLILQCPEIQAIILYGSLSTESFIMTPHEKKTYHFESDIDLIAVVPPLHFIKERLKSPKLCWNLKNGMPIDVHFETKYTLRHPTNIMEYHNLYKSGVTLYGENFLTPVPQSIRQPLPPGQALRLLCNRLWGILDAFYTKDKAELLLHRLNKGLMACYQTELIINQQHEVLLDLLLEKINHPPKPLAPTDKLLSTDFQHYLRSHFTGQSHCAEKISAQELLPLVLKLIFSQVKQLLQSILQQQITNWSSTLLNLPETTWSQAPYYRNWALFTFRKIIRYHTISSRNFFKPLSSPVCLRIWSGWLTLGLALAHPEQSIEHLNTYNEIMTWFPGFKQAETIEEAISQNPYWQGMVPVTTHI